jgi:hypothetical protein
MMFATAKITMTFGWKAAFRHKPDPESLSPAQFTKIRNSATKQRTLTDSPENLQHLHHTINSLLRSAQ